MLPIRDENIPGKGPPFVTLLTIAVNVLVFVFLQLPDESFTYAWAAVPAELTSGEDIVRRVNVPGGSFTLGESPEPIYLTVLSSMFMHGGWLHLAGNMLFLWIFGDNVEHAVGHLPFLLFYLLTGAVATFAHVLVQPESLIPLVGASGAISGVLGAYLVMFPANRVLVVVLYFVMWVPAVLVIGLWAFLQFINGFGQIAMTEQTAGVAYLAHVGGFVAGALIGLALRAAGRVPSRGSLQRAAQRGWR
ncbi:MAG TPA: rhomboid family intramembrane serine protease [Candidatus Limnocylindria bacterium]|nr:rhomboid family intramembrane serine protease [Candidatus Limnocylindria bacterium]